MNIPKSKRKKALIIVDVQPIFLNDKNRHVVSNIAYVIREFPYDLYINAVFYADKDSMWHKQLKWTVPKKEARTYIIIRKLLDKKKNIINVIKQTKSVFKPEKIIIDNKNIIASSTLKHQLFLEGIEEVHIVGLDTNDCVLATAYEAFDLGFFTYVIEECVQSSGGDNIHRKGIDLLRYAELTNYPDYKK
ncbi:MAG TPA: cysteine hydrolase family protein [Bacteroidia bacterium]|jgi:nicotinamidase-related amidase|nr:cysteine hydrolase family protein [Bacteroidia bacterium]